MSIAKRVRRSNSGFTILEILLVTVLLFILSYAVYLSVRTTTRTKEIVEGRTEILQEFRSAYGILERDLRSTFYVTADDFGWFPHKPSVDDQGIETGDIPPIPAKPTPITLFRGTETMLFFSTRSHQRLSADAPENEEHFVFYELKSNQLIRSESRRAIRIEDREHPEEYRSFILIDKVISLKFGFWNAKQGRYVSEWDSDKTEFLNKVPEAVKIEIKFSPEFQADKGTKSKELFLVTAVRIPEAWYRNIEWTAVSSAGAANQGAAQGAANQGGDNRGQDNRGEDNQGGGDQGGNNANQGNGPGGDNEANAN